MNCRLAAGLSDWVEKVLQPVAQEMLGSRIMRIVGASSYSCRNIYNNPKLSLSEHATGNAIDIAGFVTADGRTITVAKGWGPTERDIAAAKKKAAEVEARLPPRRRRAPRRPTAEPTPSIEEARQEGRRQAEGRVCTRPDFKRGRRASPPQVASAVEVAPATTKEATFLKRLHGGSCSVFATVLGPEANEAHRDHFHLDMKERQQRRPSATERRAVRGCQPRRGRCAPLTDHRPDGVPKGDGTRRRFAPHADELAERIDVRAHSRPFRRSSPACSSCRATSARWSAFALFVLAGLTDWLDGYLARAWEQQSTLGRMLDPIADKLLVGAVLMMLVHDNTITGWSIWAAIIILVREILVSGLREFLAELNVKIHVTQLAKWKTTMQMIALAVLLAGPAAEKIVPGIMTGGLVILWIAALLTLWTGYDYLKAGVVHAMER